MSPAAPAAVLPRALAAAGLGALQTLAFVHTTLWWLPILCIAWLAGAGYDPVYGARPLKRVIQRSLQNPLATMILEGRINDGETVTVSSGEGGLIINGVKAEAA